MAQEETDWAAEERDRAEEDGYWEGEETLREWAEEEEDESDEDEDDEYEELSVYDEMFLDAVDHMTPLMGVAYRTNDNRAA